AAAESGAAAPRQASAKFSGVSDPTVSPGRCAPTTTIGFVDGTVRCKYQAVSSSVPVPCDITAPVMCGAANTVVSRCASCCQCVEVRYLERNAPNGSTAISAILARFG